MKKNRLLLYIIVSLFLFSCENIKKSFGITKNSPDEFLVEKRQSILLPPDYNLLPPDSKSINENLKKDENLEFILNEQIKTSTDIKKKNSDLQNKNKSLEDQILNKIN